MRETRPPDRTASADQPLLPLLASLARKRQALGPAKVGSDLLLSFPQDLCRFFQSKLGKQDGQSSQKDGGDTVSAKKMPLRRGSLCAFTLRWFFLC